MGLGGLVRVGGGGVSGLSCGFVFDFDFRGWNFSGLVMGSMERKMIG